MRLTRKQFDILTCIDSNKGYVPFLREIAPSGFLPSDSIRTTLMQMENEGLIQNNVLTELGLAALEPYRVKRALFLAAGLGSRLSPITLNTPKPLVRVNGVRMIDTLLDAVLEAGIEEIIIVRGYLGEQFEQLLYKYPKIKFIENPDYRNSNNISSAMCIRHLMQNAYVLEADLVLRNKSLISKYQYSSNYLGVPTDITDDWCFETKNKIITRLKVGGTNCYHMFGISYWDQMDGARMAEHIKTVYDMPGGQKCYWDQIALEYFIEDYKIEVRECSFADIAEIDSYSELKQMDNSYCF